MTQERDASLLDRFGLEGAPVPDADCYVAQEDYLAFGISREAWGREPMLNFINCRGNHHALSSSHLYGVKFNPSLGVVIETSKHYPTSRTLLDSMPKHWQQTTFGQVMNR